MSARMLDPSPMPEPTDAQRRQLDEHTAAELEFDVDATMRTVDDDAEYEWQPAGLRIRGRDEIAAHVRRVPAPLEGARPTRSSSGSRSARSSGARWAGSASRSRSSATSRATVDRHDFVVVVLFGEHGVKGERTYSSPEFARLTLGDYYDDLVAAQRPPT